MDREDRGRELETLEGKGKEDVRDEGSILEIGVVDNQLGIAAVVEVMDSKKAEVSSDVHAPMPVVCVSQKQAVKEDFYSSKATDGGSINGKRIVGVPCDPSHSFDGDSISDF